MEKIESFRVDHTKLLPGLYVSRKDKTERATVTTFDLRFTAPNREPVMETAAIHTIEHLGATYLRNSPAKSEVVYFGPMGCRTGFYLLMFGDRTPEEIFPLVRAMCEFILSYEGEIPGAKPEECGNYSEQDPVTAKVYTARYLEALRKKRFEYSQ